MSARVLSALVAAGILCSTAYFGGAPGLYVICSLIAFWSLVEYSRLTFKTSNAPLHLRVDFVALAYAIYLSVVFVDEYALYVCAVSSVLFLTVTLLTAVRKDDLSRILQMMSAALVGFIYCAIFPGLVTKTATLPRGEVWLFGLLGIVFAGDTFAYFAGRAFGRRKLLEAVSPKKTLAGAAGGLLGSMVAGAVLGFAFFRDQPILLMIAAALTTGVFAQAGDLFESLLKRVAEVKDSGSIMPGHGGVLDRLDGVYFAAPVYFLMIKFMTESI